MTNGRVRLLLSKGHSCYRPRRDVSNRILKKLTDLIILKIKPVYLYRENASASLSVDVLLTATWLFSTWPSSRKETMRSLDLLIIPSLGLSIRETISFIYQIHTYFERISFWTPVFRNHNNLEILAGGWDPSVPARSGSCST